VARAIRASFEAKLSGFAHRAARQNLNEQDLLNEKGLRK
jgi:hypothetical protein